LGEELASKFAFKNPVPTQGATFGGALATFENLLLVGAFNYGPPEELGRAYLLNGKTGEQIRAFDSPAGGRWFGEGLAVNDKYTVIGAPFTKVGTLQVCGRVHIYDAASGKLLRKIDSPN